MCGVGKLKFRHQLNPNWLLLSASMASLTALQAETICLMHLALAGSRMFV